MGWLLALLLALASPPASGLQLEAGRAAAAPGGAGSVLLVVAGLSRHLEATWPGLERSLLVPNEEAGYEFRIIFSTDTSLGCHPGSPQWLSRKCEEPTDRASQLQAIKEAIAPRKVEVVDPGPLCGAPSAQPPAAVGGAPLGEASEAPYDVGFEWIPDGAAALLRTSSSCAPWWERVHRVVAGVVEGGERFDRVVALRPDMVLQWAPGGRSEVPGRPEGPPELLLDRMCQQRPGLSFVTPNWTIPHRSTLHNRDLDFMHILCAGRMLHVYEEAIRAPSAPCFPAIRSPAERGLLRPPTIPPGFKNTKRWTVGSFLCGFVQAFNDSGVPLGHWDDTYHCGWPDLPDVMR